MTDRQRIMACTIDEMRLAVGQLSGDFFRQMNRESPILRSMPQSNRNAHFFDAETPRLRINLRVRHYPFSRSAPGAPLAFKNGFECRGIAETIFIARSQHQHFQEQRPKSHRQLQ